MKQRGTMTLLLVGVAIFVIAQLGWWLYFQNSYVERVSGETVEAWQRDAQVVGQLLARGGDAAATLRAFPHLRLTGDGVGIDPERLTAFLDGQERRLRMFTMESSGFVALMIVAFMLMGQRLRVERELKQQQQNFLSAVTHELKTPMSSMRLLVETALMRPLPPEKQRSYLQRLEGELGRLERLSETVLASTRLEAGATRPELAPLELTGEVRSYLATHAASFEARGADISLVTASTELPVLLDRPSLNLIMTNLIDNAIKYSPGAAKPVEVRLEGRGHLIRLHVTDAGPGIPPGTGQKVFDRFYRAGSELVRTAPGVGLGLYLVRSAAEDMNGWISHQTAPSGSGTRFTLTLPRRLGAATEVSLNPDSAQGSAV